MHCLQNFSCFNTAARDLYTKGYTFLQGYDNEPSTTAQKSFAAFLRNCPHEVLRSLTFNFEDRPDGKYEPDDGFLNWEGGQSGPVEGVQKDVKRMFHYRPSVWKSCLKAVEVHGNMSEAFDSDMQDLLSSCDNLFEYHKYIAIALLGAFDDLRVYPKSLQVELYGALHAPCSTSRSLVRLLDYPPQENEERAHVHFDRSFLTLHSGDEGGELFIRHPSGSEESISPKQGEILAFWGAKAQMVTGRYRKPLMPIAHGSRSEIQTPRRAVVSFWHVNRVLWDAPKVPY